MRMIHNKAYSWEKLAVRISPAVVIFPDNVSLPIKSASTGDYQAIDVFKCDPFRRGKFRNVCHCLQGCCHLNNYRSWAVAWPLKCDLPYQKNALRDKKPCLPPPVACSNPCLHESLQGKILIRSNINIQFIRNLALARWTELNPMTHFLIHLGFRDCSE